MKYMNECSFDRLDALIALSSRSLIDDEAEKFLELEPYQDISEKARRKAMHIIKRAERKKCSHPAFHALKIVAIACLICISLVFTACVSIPEVREAMWEAVVEWYDEYIALKFRGNSSQSGASSRAPASIEEVNLPGYMSEGYTTTAFRSKTLFSADYYDSDGKYAFTYIQGTQERDILQIDTPNEPPKNIDINGSEGILMIEDGIMTVVWQDSRYLYVIQGVFETQEDILKVCRSVKQYK